MDFVIWTWFVIWALAFELHPSFASMRQSAGPHGLAKTNGKPTKRIVCTLTSESAADARLTYEKELLNFRKDSHFYKTNHFWLPRVSPPTPMARKNKWQTDETNRGTLTTECAGGNRLAYEKESSNSWKTSHSYKTNHPGFPATVAHATSVK
jgi:hypothetical protein